ncbi:MAG: hypothetical protein RL215_1361 [Planctomycetota bacterium]
MLAHSDNLLPRLAFVQLRRTRVRDLRGFRRGHQAPTEFSDHAAAFVARIAADDLSAELDERFTDFRRLLKCRRTELQTNDPEAGTAAINAPGFEFRITASLAQDDPSEVLWRRQLSGFTERNRVCSPELAQLFPNTFDTLEFLPLQPPDPVAVIDRIEEQSPPDVVLNYDRHATWCSLTLPRQKVEFHITAELVSLRLQQPATPETLLSLFIQLQNLSSPRQQPPQRPTLEVGS